MSDLINEAACSWHEGCQEVRPASRLPVDCMGWGTFTVKVITGEKARSIGTVPVREAKVVLCPEHARRAAMMIGCPIPLDA